LIHSQLTILQHLAVQPSNGLLKVCALHKLHESESLGIACHPVPDHLCRCHLETRVGHKVGQVIIGDTASQVSYKQFRSHNPPFCGLPSKVRLVNVQSIVG